MFFCDAAALNTDAVHNKQIMNFAMFEDKLKQKDDQLLNSSPPKNTDYVPIEDRHISQAILLSQYLGIADRNFRTKIYTFFTFTKILYKYDQIERRVR